MSKQEKNQTKQDYLNNIGSRIQVALTQQEISQLLDALFSVLSDDLRAKVFTQLSSDTQKTLKQVLTSSKSIVTNQENKSQPISQQKLAQIWMNLWREWDEVIEEAAQEKGKYIAQEVDWEAPYFDSYTFAEDLDKVAQKIQPLIDAAFENQFHPNTGFISALVSAENEISSGIPDWMDIDDGIYLLESVTNCLLKWEWLSSQKSEQDAFEFVQKLRLQEEKFEYMALNGDAVTDFLIQLPEKEQRCILAELDLNKENKLWQDSLENTYSHWHQFYMEVIHRYAPPERYLNNLRSTIGQQWQNGLAVIENLLTKNEFTASLSVIEETLDSLLKSRHREQPWSPETSLLFPLVNNFYGNNGDWTNERTLLQYYQQTSVGLGQLEQSEALKIQLAIFESCFDWPAVFKAFTEIPLSKTTHKSLFQSWRDYIIRCTKPRPHIGFYQKLKTVDDWWLYWLIDCAASTEQDASHFQQKLLQWLTNLSGDKQELGEDYDILRLLTKDLTQIYYQGQAPYPKFYEIVIKPKDLSSHDDACRQSYLQQYAPDNLWDKVISYWKAQLQNFVPRPELSQNSNYTEHSQWMAALKELAPQGYKELISKWKVKHHRRRNLWKAMENAGLDKI